MPMSDLIREPDQISLQEEENVESLLGNPPGWMLRWGISLVLLLIVLLLLIGNLVRYPDIIAAPAVIQASSPPIRLEARTDGRVEALLVSDGQAVQTGDLLLILQSAARYNDVQQLSLTLDALSEAIDQEDLETIELPSAGQLGNLQNTYAQLSAQVEAQQYMLSQDDIRRRIRILERQIRQIDLLADLLQEELDTLHREVQLARRNRDIYRKLWEEGSASEEQWEEKDMNYLRHQRATQAKERELVEQELERARLREQIILLQQQESDQLAQGWTHLRQTIQKLRGESQTWRETYLLTAPMRGQVSLSKIWSPNQTVHKNEAIMTLLPENGKSEVIARARLPLYRAGKVEPGLRVLLRIHAYPYKEFGALEGRVQQVSPLPETLDGEGPAYQVIIALPGSDTLYTTHRKAIPFQQELNAQARIITADRSFLQRILEPVLSALRNH